MIIREKMAPDFVQYLWVRVCTSVFAQSSLSISDGQPGLRITTIHAYLCPLPLCETKLRGIPCMPSRGPPGIRNIFKCFQSMLP